MDKLKICPKNTIFIVVKYYPATLNFGQILLPIQLDVISEQNKLDIAKRLMCAFAETYNLEFNNDYTIKQYFQSPTVLSNFNESIILIQEILKQQHLSIPSHI